MARARPAAGLVQVARPTARAPSPTRAACCATSASSCPRRPRSASGTRRPSCATSSCRCGPTGTEGWSEERARRARHARLDDRHRPAARPGESPRERRPRHGRHARLRRRSSPSPTSPSSTPSGSGACSRSRSRWARPASGTLDAARFAREDCRRPTTSRARTTRSGWPASSACSPSAGSSSAAEIAAGRPLDAARARRAGRSAGRVGEDAAQRRPDEPGRAAAPARFAEGDRVRARTMHPATHTRLPRYVRGHVGTVVLVHGCHVFPDVNAHGGGEDPQWLYTVRFDGRELWGAGHRPERRGLGRRVRALPGARRERRRGRRGGRAPRSPPRRRRPGLRRAVGGAGVRARRRAARARRVHLAGVGRGARRGDPARAGRRRPGHGRDLLPPLAGGARAPRRREGRRRRRDARRATPTPGAAPPTARRTARRSTSRRATSPDLSAAAPARPARAPRRTRPPSGARPRAAAARRARGAGPRGRATASRSRAAGPGSAASA